MIYYLAMSTKEEVLKILENNRDRYISGEEMAELLKVSRASIWKGVKALCDSGYEIEGLTKKGYKLISDDIMSKETLEGLIKIPVFQR